MTQWAGTRSSASRSQKMANSSRWQWEAAGGNFLGQHNCNQKGTRGYVLIYYLGCFEHLCLIYVFSCWIINIGGKICKKWDCFLQHHMMILKSKQLVKQTSRFLHLKLKQQFLSYIQIEHNCSVRTSLLLICKT